MAIDYAQLGKLASALNKARLDFKPISQSGVSKYKDKKGKVHERNYPLLSDYHEATTSALAKHDICVMQPLEEHHDENGKHYQVLKTIIIHGESGQVYEAPACRIPDMEDFRSGKITFYQMNFLQAFGSYISYVKKYAYCAALCLSAPKEYDDDGSLGHEEYGYTPDTSRTKPKVTQPKPREAAPQVAPRLSAKTVNVANEDKATRWMELYQLTVPELQAITKEHFNGEKVRFLNAQQMEKLKGFMAAQAKVKQNIRHQSINVKVSNCLAYHGVSEEDAEKIRVKYFSGKPLLSLSDGEIGEYLQLVEQLAQDIEEAKAQELVASGVPANSLAQAIDTVDVN